MGSPHYRTACEYLKKNIELLDEEREPVDRNGAAIRNLNDALISLCDALQDEFCQIETRLTTMQMRLDRE
jgi:hypothetical protein